MPDIPLEPPAVRVGVFDSGVGGLSILRALRAEMPMAELLYVADSGHAPYGERSEDYVIARSVAITDFLLTHGAQIIVVACNTATASAALALRARHPQLAIVGVEPGVKPAVKASRTGRIAVMATTGTLRSEKFQQLIHNHQGTARIHLQACPGLAKAIETGDLYSPEIEALVAQFTAPLKVADVDTVVLGCTHYPFVAPLIQQQLGGSVLLIDTAQAVARRTVHLAMSMSPPQDLQTGTTTIWSSGEPAAVSEMIGRWLPAPIPVLPLPAAPPQR